MKNQFSIPRAGASLTNWVGDTISSFPGLGTVSVPALFGSSAPSCFPLQSFYRPWKRALEILGTLEGDLLGVVPKPVWRSNLLDPLESGQAAVSSLEDQQVQLGCNADPAKSRQSQFEEIIFSGDLVIENGTALPQIAFICTHEVVRKGLSSPAVNTKSEPGIASWVDQSDAQVRAEQSFEITSTEAQTAHYVVLCELDLMAPRPVWMGDVLNLPASGRVLAPTPHDQQYPPQYGAESTKSATAQPEEINLDKVSTIKNATENLHCDCPSTKKSPDGQPCRFKFSDRWPGQSQWLGTLSATKNFAGPTVLGGSHSKNYSSKRIPKATESTREVVRSWVYLPPKNTDREPGIGSWVDQSDAQVRVKQSFDSTSIKALPAQFGVIDGLDAIAPVTNLRQHITECRADFESPTPLLSRLTRTDSPSLSPAKCRSTDSESAQSETQNAVGYPTHRSLGWLDHQTNHMPLGHPNEVPRINFLVKATTISVRSRPKAGCHAPQKTTRTPIKTTP